MKPTKINRDWIQFYASLILLVAGVVLVFIALLLEPVGVIHYSVLTAFGMFLTFVGAVWQLDVKYTFKTKEMRNELFLRGMENNLRDRYRKHGFEVDEGIEEEYYDEDRPESEIE